MKWAIVGIAVVFLIVLPVVAGSRLPQGEPTTPRKLLVFLTMTTLGVTLALLIMTAGQVCASRIWNAPQRTCIERGEVLEVWESSSIISDIRFPQRCHRVRIARPQTPRELMPSHLKGEVSAIVRQWYTRYRYESWPAWLAGVWFGVLASIVHAGCARSQSPTNSPAKEEKDA